MNPVVPRRLRPLLAAGLAVAAAAAAASPRVAQLEQALRGQPEHAVAVVQALLPGLNPGEQVRAQLFRASMLLYQGQPAAAEALAAEIEALSPRVPEAAAAAALVRARVAARTGPAGRADRLLQEAAGLVPAKAPVSLRLRLLESRSSVKQSLGKFDQAVDFLQQALALADAEAPVWQRAEVRATLAYVLVLAQQPQRARSVLREADALAADIEDLPLQANLATTRSIVASALGDSAEELRSSQAAITLAHRAGDKRHEVLSIANLADYYLKRHDYPTALRLAQQALPLAQEAGDVSGQSVALTNAGLALIALGQHAEGQRLVGQALALEERLGALTEMLVIQEELGHALERAGLLREAWQALTEHRRLADEVFQRQHQQALLELQEGFDAERRQRELAALQTARQLQEAQLTQRELQQRLWIAGLVAGVLLLAVVAELLRRMRRSNAQLQSTNAQLQVASERDPLTGLSNRRHLLRVMERSAASGQGFDGSLLLIDIDHFKRINDSHGHATGDTVLVEVARRITSALREDDLTVRWGGEEFLVVLHDTPPDEVEQLAQRLLAAIGREPVALDGSVLAVTASIGFATFPLRPRRDPLSWEKAIDLVDTAMYLAKAHGRNRAYGVRALDAEQGAHTTAQPEQLETAWRSGRAELAHLPGPTRETV